MPGAIFPITLGNDARQARTVPTCSGNTVDGHGLVTDGQLDHALALDLGTPCFVSIRPYRQLDYFFTWNTGRFSNLIHLQSDVRVEIMLSALLANMGRHIGDNHQMTVPVSLNIYSFRSNHSSANFALLQPSHLLSSSLISPLLFLGPVHGYDNKPTITVHPTDQV